MDKTDAPDMSPHEPYNEPEVGFSIKNPLEEIFGRVTDAMPIYEKLNGVKGIAKDLRSDLVAGVSASSVDTRRDKFGRNALPEEEPITFWQIFLNALSDHMIIILIFSAIVSLILGLTVPAAGEDEVDRSHGWIEGAAILVSVTIVLSVSSINDYRKELKFRKLTEENSAQPVTVIRDGSKSEVDVTDIVVGDLLFINPGLVMPVDGFYVKGASVVVDESSVTGENDPKKKDEKRPFFLGGTVVNTAENTWILVGAVGENSFGGKLLMGSRQEGGPKPTPLQDRLDDMADLIGKFGIIAAVVLFVVLATIEVVRIAKGDENGRRLLDYFIVSVALIVVCVPEGLPLAVTIALAYSQNKMRKDNNRVRRLKACETMGNATQICSDKTGTLTQNLMSVVQLKVAETHHAIEKPGEFLEKIEMQGLHPEVLTQMNTAIALCSSSQKTLTEVAREGQSPIIKWVWDLDKGNKTDNALLDFVDRSSLQDSDLNPKLNSNYSLPHQRIRELTETCETSIFPFTSVRKRMSIVIKRDHGLMHYVKGGSEVILPVCTSFLNSKGEIEPMTDERRAAVQKAISDFADEANRTIGVAFTKLPGTQCPEDEPDVKLTWISLIGIQDPLRPEVTEAVRKCVHAGVTVRMCTGDNLQTAIAIAHNCGIYNKEKGDIAVEGREFRDLVYDSYAAIYSDAGDEEADEKARCERFWKILDRITIVARSQPLDKQLLVLQHMLHGEVVAVTGDGTNDAPALRLANVGFVMRSGTDIAVKSADIVLLDDNFKSVQRAVVWGRCVNDNIRKFLQLQLTVNVASVLLVFIGSVSNTDDNTSPLSTVQLLWVNLLMDTFAALALATEEPDESCLDRGPIHRSSPLISRRMFVKILTQGVWESATALLILHFGHKWFSLTGTEEVVNETAVAMNLTDPGGETPTMVVENDGQYSRHHRTIIFNAFVWQVLCDMFSSRKLYQELNLFEGFGRSKIFFFILAISVSFQVMAVELFGDWIQTEGLEWQEWLVCLGLGLLSWPIVVISRLFDVQEPDAHEKFTPEDLDEDAQKTLEKLEEEIKEQIKIRRGENRSFGHAMARYETPSSPRPISRLWQRAKQRSVQSLQIVRAFRRAHLDRDLHTVEGKRTYNKFLKSHPP